MRTPSTFSPDSNVEGVAPEDIMDNAIEARHIGDGEIGPEKMAASDGAGILIVFTLDITTGSASELIFDAAVPFACEIVDVVIQPRGASTNGTMKITDGTNDITDAMVCAVDKTVARAGTIDNAYSTLAAGDTLEVVCAGDTVADTIGLVTVYAVKA